MVFKRNTAIDAEALSVIGKSKKFEFPEFKVYLHNKNIDLYIEHFFQFHVERNYTDNITDKIMVSFLLPKGYYKEWILKDRDNLEMTIILKYKGKRKPLINRYKFIPDIDKEELGGQLGSVDAEDLNKHELQEVKGQCISPLFLILKTIYINGIYRKFKEKGNDSDYDKITIEEFLTSIFHKHLKNLTVFSQPLDYDLFVYKPDNEKLYDNILIKSGTKLIALPVIMQEDMFGVYNGGLNVYFTNLHVSGTDPNHYGIYIYPVFDKERFNNETIMPKLVILEPTNPDMSKNDIEAYYKDGLYKIIVTNSEKILKLEREKYNTITGIDVALSENMLGGYRVDTERFVRTSIDTSNYNEKFRLDEQLRNFINIENVDFDSNILRHLARFQKYQTKFFHMHLVNTNPIFLYPGMPVKYITVDNNRPITYTGVVHNVSFSYMVQKKVVSTDILIGVRQ